MAPSYLKEKQSPSPNDYGFHRDAHQRAFGQGHAYGHDPISRMRSDDDMTLTGGVSDQPSNPSLRGQTSRTPLSKNEIRRKLKAKHSDRIPGHVKWTKWMHTESKNHFVAVLGEFVGTTLFLFFAFAGTQLANFGKTLESENDFSIGDLFYVSASFGMSLLVNAWIFFRISGGLFNPAVTLALFLLKALNAVRAVLLTIAQISGACFAAYLVKVMYPTPLNVQTKLGADTTKAQGIFIEAVCTAELVFTIIMLAKEKHRATYLAPIGIGFALFIGELAAVYYTGGALNPARAFGPAAVLHSFNSHHWIYWVGPFIGTIIACLFYWLIKILEYEMANPGQDGDEENDPTANPDHELANKVEARQAEVEEIQAIQKEGGFQNLRDSQLMDRPPAMADEGIIGMAVKGVREGDEVQVTRKRQNADDLEAQWPATRGVGAPEAQAALNRAGNKI